MAENVNPQTLLRRRIHLLKTETAKEAVSFEDKLVSLLKSECGLSEMQATKLACQAVDSVFDTLTNKL